MLKHKKKIIYYRIRMSLVETDLIKPIHKKERLTCQPQETELGNKEYKRRIFFDKNSKKMIEKRRTQMLYRLYEGQGSAYYFLGVEDNGEPHGISRQELTLTISNLKKISDELNVRWTSIEIYDGWLRDSFTAVVTLKLDKDICFSIY